MNRKQLNQNEEKPLLFTLSLSFVRKLNVVNRSESRKRKDK